MGDDESSEIAERNKRPALWSQATQKVELREDGYAMLGVQLGREEVEVVECGQLWIDEVAGASHGLGQGLASMPGAYGSCWLLSVGGLVEDAEGQRFGRECAGGYSLLVCNRVVFPLQGVLAL